MIEHLDHINIITNDLDATVHFYESVLGFDARPKPSGAPGVWLYCGDRAVIHVNVAEASSGAGPANVDHVAFSATDVQSTKAALLTNGVEFSQTDRARLEITQLHFSDPNQIPIELNFPL